MFGCFVRWIKGGSFDGRKLHDWDINACPMSSMSFAQGAAGVVGAWETGGQVYFEELATANAALVSAPGAGKGRKHPRVAVGGDGEVLMAWTEGTGWQKGGSLAWQAFDRNGIGVGERDGAACSCLEFRCGCGEARRVCDSVLGFLFHVKQETVNRRTHEHITSVRFT